MLYSSLVRWLLILQFVGKSFGSSCPGFRLGSTSCTSGIFSRSNLQATCSDDGKVGVYGTLVAPSAFEDAEVSFVPCIRGTGVCFEEYTQNGGKVCDWIVAKTNGSECGSSGQYTIDQTFDVPEEVSESSTWLMQFATIKVMINDQEACTQYASSASSSAFLTVGMASLFAVGGLGLYFMRKRKRPLLVLEDQHVGKFVQMNDLSPSMSSVGNIGAISVSFLA